MLDLYYYCQEDGKVTEKEMFIQGVYKIITLEINFYDFIEKVFKLMESRYESLAQKMEGSRFSLNCVSKLTIKCININETKVSLYIKSLD